MFTNHRQKCNLPNLYFGAEESIFKEFCSENEKRGFRGERECHFINLEVIAKHTGAFCRGEGEGRTHFGLQINLPSPGPVELPPAGAFPNYGNRGLVDSSRQAISLPISRQHAAGSRLQYWSSTLF